jgi:hypothetical protein
MPVGRFREQRANMTGLLGSGVLANWGGVIEGADEDFNAWHSREHLPERLAVPGFRRGRRCVGVEGTPRDLRYLMMYEVDTPDVLVSPPYLARLNDPTPWTQRVLATYLAPCRTVCRVLRSGGHGTGGWIASFVYGEAEREAAKSAGLAEAVWAVADRPGVTGLHAIEGDPEFGQQPTTEKAFREAQGLPDSTIAIALLVEGIDRASVEGAMHAIGRAVEHLTPMHVTLYQTQHVLEAAT